MASAPLSRPHATLAGFGAVLIWASLASLTALTRALPPFQLLAMSFMVAGMVGLVWLIAKGGAGRSLLQASPAAWLLGVCGLFGYHFLYFLALRRAPAVEANLINYLWPLLIVLFSALLPKEGGKAAGLRWWHVCGAALGLAGTAVIVLAKPGTALGSGDAIGYGLALAAALVWSSYSVLSRRFAQVSTGMVAAFCLATAVLAALCHIGLETTRWPEGAAQWAAVVALGLGPVGGAFYLWDHGVKHGDLALLGALAYMTPLLSTLLLVLFGLGRAGPELWFAGALITGGAALAARDLLRARASAR